MSIASQEPYQVSNEFNITQLLSHFDSDYIFDVLDDKLRSIDYSSCIPEANIVASFEQNFITMNELYPGDSCNIKSVREQVYYDIIKILTNRFNLEFNYSDDNIDIYKAAYYLYDFVVSNRNTIMTNFFVSFIVNNKDSLYNMISMSDTKRTKDSTTIHAKNMYIDQKYVTISSNIVSVINHISTLDVRLVNIFQSTYTDPSLVMFLDNAFADKGNFFKDYYCSVLNMPEILPILITNIRLQLQKFVGTPQPDYLGEILSYGGE